MNTEPCALCVTPEAVASLTPEAISEEISAIAEAQVADTKTDVNPWAVAEDEERNHEAEDRVAELEIQLEVALLEQAAPDAEQ